MSATRLRQCLNHMKWRQGLRSIYTAAPSDKPAIVVGVHQGDEEGSFRLTKSGDLVNSALGGQITDALCKSGPVLKAGKNRTFHNVHPDHGPVIAVGLGKSSPGLDLAEGIYKDREAIRKAVSAGVRLGQEAGCSLVRVDDCGDGEAAAEGATMSTWIYQDFKKEKKTRPVVEALEAGVEGWEVGVTGGEAQNLARMLMEAPANHMTPTRFVEVVSGVVEPLGVEVRAREKAWAAEMGMGAFLSVAAGSHQPPMFLEMAYNGGPKDQPPVVMVGKGVTFDTGGISIKPSAKMDLMRGDMGGAATVAAALSAIAQSGAGVNVVALIPLTENMPSGGSTKPGDVVKAMNGKTIQVDNTDAEGRLILADALCYADQFSPRVVLDVATLTGAMSVALGSAATGVFSSDTSAWSKLEAAGAWTGDRVWRMPLLQHYKDQLKSPLADLNNISLRPGGGSCTAAAFLREFTKCQSWLHLDIAGVMENGGEVEYLGKGMSGRPTRTIAAFVKSLAL